MMLLAILSILHSNGSSKNSCCHVCRSVQFAFCSHFYPMSNSNQSSQWTSAQ